MHSLLQKQLAEQGIASGAAEQMVGPVLSAISETYQTWDSDRATLDACRKELSETRAIMTNVAQTCDAYRSIFENAVDGIFQTTENGEYINCNAALARIYGYSSPEELKNSVRDIKQQLYVEAETRPRFKKIMREQGIVSGFEARIYRKDGEIIWISETARVVRDAAGNFAYFEGFVSDITARKAAEDALRESEERFSLCLRGANDGLWDWNIKTGDIYFSNRWKQMLGVPDDEIGKLPEEWFNRVHADDLETVQAAIAAHREGMTPHFEIEHRMLHKDGGYRWMLARGIAICDSTGKAMRMAGSQSDITERKEAEEQLLRDALHDGLTGLPNRALFLDRLERFLARSRRHSYYNFAVLFLDVDRFKIVNDSLGHMVGDQLLVAFAQRISTCLRTGDTLARLGGDEFTILLDETKNVEDATRVAERILESLRHPFSLAGHEMFITTSIGIAPGSPNYERPQDMLRDADTALYRAKALGKNRHQLFDSAMHARAVKLLKMENDLRRALERTEFELHYQPIVDIATTRLKGFEALIRWRRPDRGLVSPGDFLPIAEETGLIIPIGKWVLFESCRQCAIWNKGLGENDKLCINVNLAAKQFSQPDLVEQVEAALEQSGLSPLQLTLEITESTLMENAENAAAMLTRLRSLGVQVNLDDFGTGYSSLSYLQRFPVDTMKIDRSFISKMDELPENAEIVRAIVRLAHNLNIKVTAEGIETEEQLVQLRNLQCENGQGYLLSKPLPSGEAGVLVQKRRDGQISSTPGIRLAV